MFTGLVRALGKLVASKPLAGGARELTVDISGLEIKPDIGASIAINGVCQTVTSFSGSRATFCAVEETVKRTTLGRLSIGEQVNLEPSLKVGESLDGHFVLGHVDGIGRVEDVVSKESSQIWYFSMPSSLKPMIAEKGSIAIDGISLTVAKVYENTFTVSLIPHTFENTPLGIYRDR